MLCEIGCQSDRREIESCPSPVKVLIPARGFPCWNQEGKSFCDPDADKIYIDTFDGAKPRFSNRGKKRRSVSTLSIPRALARGVEWVDSLKRSLHPSIVVSEIDAHSNDEQFAKAIVEAFCRGAMHEEITIGSKKGGSCHV